MVIIIGSARIDERGKASGGMAGDQKQTGKNDYRGEVSLQEFYVHRLGWYILRPIKPEHAIDIAQNMADACDNVNLGYDQSQRLGVITKGIHTAVKTECDCSSLVRECVREATGVDPGDFTTLNEAARLEATGLFEDRMKYVPGIRLYTGDVLVTCTKGHTAIVTEGNIRPDMIKDEYEPGNYKTKEEAYLRSAPLAAEACKVPYKSLPLSVKLKCSKDSAGFAVFGENRAFTLVEYIKQENGDIWGKIKSGYYLPLRFRGRERAIKKA